MSMNPILTTKNIKNDYLSYLESMMMVRNPEINRKTREAIRINTFVKGPYIESTPPFVTGCSLQNLVEDGIASEEFYKLGANINIERSLYIHQEQSFKKIICDKKNIIVSTGTGSGKTECYLYPIFDYLMKEKEAGILGSGVRALLLFPMNALANDQMKRLREVLSEYPDITYGRYTGETLEKQKDAKDKYIEKYKKEPMPNELISRDEMRSNPPNILLTNYAMLEYLLLRPMDSELFDGNNGSTWRFIVLDEAHTYKGATGTEIAFLLRRLKDRICNNKKGKLQCIATSATLGDINKLEDLALFATTIFDEKFNTDDIILSERINIDYLNEMHKFSPLEYEEILNKTKEIQDENERGKIVYGILKNDSRIIAIQKVLKEKPKLLYEVAKDVFPDLYSNDDKENSLTKLIELGALAKPNINTAALLPARYHLFIKALEGMYVMFYPTVQVFLDRKESWPNNGNNISVFELANCQHCGQEYIVGNNINGYLKQPKETEKPEYYMIASQYSNDGNIDIDEDDEAFEEVVNGKTEEYILCTACGKLIPANQKNKDVCCDVNDRKKLIRVYKLASKGESNTCAMCGSLSPSIIKRFMTSNQAATFVLSNSLYNMIPPNVVHVDSETVKVDDFIINDDFFTDYEIIIKNDYINESGRKLLIFSDNRQEAAYFAGYMNNKYNQNLWRKLIIKELKKTNNGLMLDDLINRLLKSADELGLYNDDEDARISSDRKMIIASQYVFSEFMGSEKLSGLEGRGYIEFYPESLQVKDSLNLDGEHYWNLLRFMMDTLRFSNATNYPENVSAEDEFFEPRNRYVYFRKAKRGNVGSKQILGFIPHEKRNNKRISVINKMLIKQGVIEKELNDKSKKCLETVYGQFVKLIERGYFVRHQLQIEGTCLAINYKKWKVRYISDKEVLYKCNRCGKISSYTIDGFCTEMKCNGITESINAKEYRYDPYYSKLYTDEKLIPMTIKEHTAQLKKDRAGKFQEDFEKGIINILSCSTTFEMGVDVGQLEAILLRNVPPETSNYVQRAGRAGRRTSSTAFSVTFARRNSHDLNYFKEPQEIISGKIKAPYIEINNEKIAFRHANSIICSWFFKEYKEYFSGGAGTIAGYNGYDDMAVILRKELEQMSEEIKNSMYNVFSSEVLYKIGFDDGSYINRLVDEEYSEELNGVLSKAVAERSANLESLDLLYNEFLKKKNLTQAQQVEKLKNTFDKEGAIPFLAANGVIPKYGFPIDVVRLDMYNNSDIANGIDVSRDLKMAITEFAPGSSIVAGGKVWKSHVINTIKNKGWPTYRYYECPSCKIISPPETDKEIAVLNNNFHESDQEIHKICRCGVQMKEKKFIIPIFGFSTCLEDKPKNVGDQKPKKNYSTRVQFWGIDKLDAYQEKEIKVAELTFNNRNINAMYSPNGKLVVLNRGINGAGLFICQTCGYAQSFPQNPKENHKNKHGNACRNKNLVSASLGHKFNSDILKLEMPAINFNEEYQYLGNKYASVLYAILDGASDSLGIARSDINGCIDYTTNTPTLIMFDESVGGAGHVKRIFNNLENVFNAAIKRVDGSCGCGPETSCYGCLRNYNNQFEHDELVRGLAYNYLKLLLGANEYNDMNVALATE